MKRILSFSRGTRAAALAAAGLALLTACGGSTSGTAAQGSAAQSAAADASAAPVADTSQLRLITSTLGADATAGAEAGLYQIVPNATLGCNILYSDYATGSTVYLCNDPNCTHNSDSCTSWLENSGAEIFADSQADALYLITGDESGSTLWQMHLDGTDRKALYQTEASESLLDAVASDGENLYMDIHAFVGNSAQPAKRLVKLNTQTGEATTLVEYADSDWLFGAFQDKLLLLYYDGTSFTYRTFSVTDNTQQDVFSYGNGTVSGASYAWPNGQYLYIFEPKDAATARVDKLDMATGERQALCESVPYFGSEPIAIGKPLDKYLFVSVYNPKEAYGTPGRDVYYMLDCDTGLSLN